jgi:hypothetical protein
MLGSNLIRCQNGHMFNKKKHGTVCPYCNIETATPEKKELLKTDIQLEEELFREDTIPVCAWMVCIGGINQGRSYKIIQGKNFLGRGDDMDIQIVGDNEVDNRNHAIIVFDPKKKETVLLPGDSNGLVYLGGNAVYLPTPLKPYSRIEIGKSHFIFIPFCGTHFMWGNDV